MYIPLIAKECNIHLCKYSNMYKLKLPIVNSLLSAMIYWLGCTNYFPLPIRSHFGQVLSKSQQIHHIYVISTVAPVYVYAPLVLESFCVKFSLWLSVFNVRRWYSSEELILLLLVSLQPVALYMDFYCFPLYFMSPISWGHLDYLYLESVDLNIHKLMQFS